MTQKLMKMRILQVFVKNSSIFFFLCLIYLVEAPEVGRKTTEVCSKVESEGPRSKQTKFSQDLDDIYDSVVDSDDGAI